MRCALALLVAGWLSLAASRPVMAAPPLELATVIDSVARHYPLIEAAQREQQVAEAELQSAQGAFDPLLRTRFDGTPLGYYQSGRFDFLLEVPTQLWGSTLFAGYRASFGKLADYDGKLETNQFGELRAGLAIPLLRNGAIDRRRATLARAKLAVPLAATSVKQTQLEATRAASYRYWEWVAAGQRLQLAETLLGLAESRDLATEERLRRGDLARIDRVDNQRTVLSRRGAVVQATRGLQAAAIELSIYLRDEQGRPLLIDRSSLPTPLSPASSGSEEPSLAEPLLARDTALRNRPELERLRLVGEQLRVERDWARNQALPALDLVATVSQDFGPGSDSRAPTVLDGGLSLEFPTLNRVARGRRLAAEAALARLLAQARLTSDRIGAEVADAQSALSAARQRLELVQAEVLLSKEVETAERSRFALGDSTILFVNLREQATAESALREIDALLEYRRAQANYRAALAVP